MDLLHHIDLKLLYFINHQMSNALFDYLMPLLRGKLIWSPLYVLIIYFTVKKYGLKSIWVIGFALLTVLIADRLSAGLLKPYFQRLRPCNNPELSDWLLLPHGKGSGWSFVSSHATNHFAISVYFILVFIGYKHQLKVAIPFLFWALVIAFAQVYIGFHYPSDVIAGGLIGCLIGYAMGRLNCLVLCYRSGLKI